MSTDKLGLFKLGMAEVMPSIYHEVIRLCIHEKRPSFMTSQVCISAVGSVKVRSVILEFQASYLPWECENPQVNLTLEFSHGGSLQ